MKPDVHSLCAAAECKGACLGDDNVTRSDGGGGRGVRSELNIKTSEMTTAT